MFKYTYHCSTCENQVDEFCAEHPEATVESIVSSYGTSASQVAIHARLLELTTEPFASPFPLVGDDDDFEPTVIACQGIAPCEDSDPCEICIAGSIEGES